MSKPLVAVRPGMVNIGDRVLSNVGAINLHPRVFTVVRLDEAVLDAYVPGATIQLVLLENHDGHGGWVTLWDRAGAAECWHEIVS